MPKGIYPRISALERLWHKIKITESGCWEWQGVTTSFGYGRMGLNKKHVLVHRFAYEQYKGCIPQGFQIDHLCRNPKCVNPMHLEAVTASENVLRSTAPLVSAQRNLSKTHCPHGHPYSVENTHHYHGQRFCKQCWRDKSQRKRQLGGME